MATTLSGQRRPVMGQMPDAAHVAKIARAVVEVAVGISRRLARGVRTPEIRKLEEQLLDGRSVTLERVLRLAVFAAQHGADVAPLWQTLATAIAGRGAGAPHALPVNAALIAEMDAQCDEMPLLARVLTGAESAAELRILRDKLTTDRMAIDLAIESLDVELAARRMVA